MNGRVLEVKSGTKAQLIKAGFIKHEVRILEGDHFGGSGFVPHEFLVPQ